jgi:anti-anti-sigma factor
MSTGPHEPPPTQLVRFSVDCARLPAGSMIATLSGDLDIANAELLVESVIAGVETDPPLGVVLDFTGVPFMDSTGLRAILEIAQRLEEDAAGLVLLNPANSVSKLLSLAGLDERIPVVASMEQAEAVLAAPGKGS